jgi:hypothetical protein
MLKICSLGNVRLCVFTSLLIFLMILFLERSEIKKEGHELNGRGFLKLNSSNTINKSTTKVMNMINTTDTDTDTNAYTSTADSDQMKLQQSTIMITNITSLSNETITSQTILTFNPSQSPSQSIESQKSPTESPKQEQEKEQEQSYFSYNISTIIQIAKQLSVVTGKLLIYDPADDRFHIYTITPNETALARMVCPRCPNTLRVLLNVIRKLRPERFTSNTTNATVVTKPYQLLWTDRDFPFTYCSAETCFSHPSWIHFGSYYRNRTLLPHIQNKPNFNYLACMYEVLLSNDDKDDEMCTYWKGIVWSHYDDNQTDHNNSSSMFSSLIPKVVWRGKDYHLLPHVPMEYFVGNWTIPYYDFKPRMHAVLLNQPWMDVRFGSNTGSTRYNSLSHEDLAAYKYHVDLGGTSGTTWTGTLEKLAMPGVLFHHETPSQDWYFDRMIPWIHYLPLRTDISDLEERYRWAEDHPYETEQMARAGTNFARDMFSKRTIRKDLEYFFGESSTMGAILDGYQQSDDGETLETILSTYAAQKIYLTEVATCDEHFCEVRYQPSFQYRFSLSNRSDCNVINCPY